MLKFHSYLQLISHLFINDFETWASQSIFLLDSFKHSLPNKFDFDSLKFNFLIFFTYLQLDVYPFIDNLPRSTRYWLLKNRFCSRREMDEKRGGGKTRSRHFEAHAISSRNFVSWSLTFTKSEDGSEKGKLGVNFMQIRKG